MNVSYDSLFREGKGAMPFPSVGPAYLENHKQHVILDYSTTEKAKKVINLNSVAIEIKSNSLDLDTSLVWLKDLTNRKIYASVGLMFKMNMDSYYKEKVVK